MEIEQHKHCIICGRAVPFKQQYCSKKCKAQHKAAAIKKQKMWMNILWALMIFLVIVLIMGGG